MGQGSFYGWCPVMWQPVVAVALWASSVSALVQGRQWLKAGTFS